MYVGMPCKLRIEHSGAMYHVMSRGDRREKIVLNGVEFSVHLNPVRAGMLPGPERLLSCPGTAAAGLAGNGPARPAQE
jgi:hypothetical protein